MSKNTQEDWDRLQEEILKNPIKNVSFMATMPTHEPARLTMSAAAEGIHPIREFKNDKRNK